MAKQKNPSPPPVSADDAPAQQLSDGALEAPAGEGDDFSATEAAGAGDVASLPAPGDGPDSALPAPSGEPAAVLEEEAPPLVAGTVQALILSNCHLGKVERVIEVDAAHAETLRLGGLVDTHPNAIKAATPED